MGDLFGDPLQRRIFKNDVISMLGIGERFLFSWVLGLHVFFFLSYRFLCYIISMFGWTGWMAPGISPQLHLII